MQRNFMQHWVLCNYLEIINLQAEVYKWEIQSFFFAFTHFFNLMKIARNKIVEEESFNSETFLS